MCPVEGEPLGGGLGSSWVSEAEADAYFETRYGASTYWTESIDKTAVLTTAQQWIEMSGYYTFEDDEGTDLTASGETPSDAMKDAVCEQALFMLLDTDMERRMSLQAQGVYAAGIIQEEYAFNGAHIVLAPMVMLLLAEYASGNPGVGRFSFER